MLSELHLFYARSLQSFFIPLHEYGNPLTRLEFITECTHLAGLRGAKSTISDVSLSPSIPVSLSLFTPLGNAQLVLQSVYTQSSQVSSRGSTLRRRLIVEFVIPSLSILPLFLATALFLSLFPGLDVTALLSSHEWSQLRIP